MPTERGPRERAPTAGELAAARSAPVPPLVTRIKRRDVPDFVRALAIGAGGGGIFALLGLPLAWMMGAMIANAIAAFAGAKLRMDVRLHTFMIVVLGIMLGSAFSPEILGRMAQWWITLVALVVYVGATGAAAFGFFRAVGGYDPRTAYFAGVPGGLNEMILLGGAMGGDDRAISLTHSTRIFLVVMTIPFLFRALAEVAPVARAAAGGASIAPIDIVLLAASAVAGIFLARLLRLPAPALTGAMIGSAAVHLAGLTEAAPPREVVAAAQLIIGTSIGIRFSGVRFRTIARSLGHAAIATLVMMALSAIFASGLMPLTGLAFRPLLLAFSPGGLAEMSLVALALDIDTAFVATHNLARIAIIVTAAPVVFRLLERRGAMGKPQPPAGPHQSP